MPERRIGAPDAKNRTVLLDATERVLLRDGYGAVSSRRVATEAGLKPQLVHYYFRSMDELYLEVFRRRAEQNLERVAEALASERPLQALWRHASDPAGAAFMVELVALANHRPAIRAEIARFAERFRSMQVEALTTVLDRYGIAPHDLPPAVAIVVVTGVSQVLVLEDVLGVTTGHAETRELVERWIDEIELGPAGAGGGRRVR